MTINIDALAEMYWAKYDPQFDDGKCECEICGSKQDIEDMIDNFGSYYCKECYEELEKEKED